MPAAVRLTLIETNLFQTKHPAEGRLAERLLFLKQKSLLSMQTTSSFFFITIKQPLCCFMHSIEQKRPVILKSQVFLVEISGIEPLTS